MGFPNVDMAQKFLRTYKKPFSLKEMRKILLGEMDSLRNVTLEETQDFLEENPNVLLLSNGKYLTRAGAFTGEIFSIVPTAPEIRQGVLVPGHRCLPFVEPDRISSTLSFYADGKKVPCKVGEFDSDAAIDMFMLYGEEYAPQYIASDPANKDLDMVSRDFELPNTVRITGIDLDFLSKRIGYTKGDRILCCVLDWDQGIVNMMNLHSDPTRFDKGEIGERRIGWFSALEKAFLESFSMHGPLGTIDEQLTNVIFENRAELCVPYCGSIEEFLGKHSRKISFEHYGVETRLWRKGEEVPAFGEWNTPFLEMRESLQNDIPFYDFAISSFPDFVLDQVILNSFFRKSEDVRQDVLDFICQDDFEFKGADLNSLNLNVDMKSCILRNEYNWFADQILGPVRQKTLDLYGKVLSYVRRVDYLGRAVLSFPSQEVVILGQLHSHLLRMLETIDSDPTAEETSDALLLSLDGMEWNLEDISPAIEFALAEERKNSFKIVGKQTKLAKEGGKKND